MEREKLYNKKQIKEKQKLGSSYLQVMEICWAHESLFLSLTVENYARSSIDEVSTFIFLSNIEFLNFSLLGFQFIIHKKWVG